MTQESSEQYRPNMRRVSQSEMMRPRPNRKTNGTGVQADEIRICVVMVGLPARGKSLIASKGEFLTSVFAYISPVS